MTDGDVPVGAHHRQQNGAGELVDRSDRQVYLAEDRSEGPVLDVHDDDQKGQSDEKHLVSDRQVQDVHVRHGLHLGEPQHDVDDQSVAAQAYDANQSVHDLAELHKTNQPVRWHFHLMAYFDYRTVCQSLVLAEKRVGRVRRRNHRRHRQVPRPRIHFVTHTRTHPGDSS